ncbi:Xaa-Pro peptidase family protein [Peptococcaceae bacterium 1198_IL3148]
MMDRVPKTELQNRLNRLRSQMDLSCPNWEMVVIFSKINLYYFTGTMQDGMLLISRDDEAVFWVRRSYERALAESPFAPIKPMHSFRDAAAATKNLPSVVHLETETIPLALFQRFKKHFPIADVRSVDRQLAAVRAIKSPYELSLLIQAGKIHQQILEETVPKMLVAGISEAELATQIYTSLMGAGHHGLTRFRMFDTEMLLGHVGFGTSSIYPTYFDGPSGNVGLSPAVPLFGNRDRKLKQGDLVYIDIGCGVDGYHTDKTMTYMFGQSPSKEVASTHNQCVAIQNQIAEMLKPGAIPSHIYRTIINNLSAEFLENFMGFGKRQVKFLGHGIGLLVDEFPVIAEGFDEPLQEGMVIAVEPKKGIANIGMVGIENTFIITPEGGRCITGDHPGLMPVF